MKRARPNLIAMPVSRRSAWRLAAASLVMGLLWLWPRVQLLVAPVSDVSLLEALAIPVSYFLLALFCSYIVGVLWALYGSRLARVTLLCIVFLMALSALINNAALIQFTLVFGAPISLSPRSLWEWSEGIRWLLWLAFNVWFFVWRPEARNQRSDRVAAERFGT